MAPPVEVRKYYEEKSIFITGATGFLGKVLVEKLLRCCPGVKRIYLLIRQKKNQSSAERLDSFIKNRVFERIENDSPKCFDKLRLVPGDMLAENLAISPEDEAELRRECQIIFHCAACVRFDLNIRDALNLNTLGTKRALTLAKTMEKLEVFLHVSTAYSRCDLPELEEKIYPEVHNPEKVLDCVTWMDDELLNRLSSKLIEPQPNTYAYTKSLTESLVQRYAGDFPIVIARPSIVTAAYKEPMPGWVDNLNGATGLLVGAGKGVIRTMLCNEDYRADLIPVDFVTNACLILACVTALEKSKKVRVCNVTASSVNPITWGRGIDMGREHVKDYPFLVTLWYPGGTVKKSWIHHQIAQFFVHMLPAYLIDIVLLLLGQKPFMVHVQKRITYGLDILQYYTTKEWYFMNDNYLALKNSLTEEENKIFYTDLREINWYLYVRDYIKGAREFCCKEDPSTLPQARRLNRILYYADLFLKTFLVFLFLYFVYYCLRKIFI